VNFAWDEAKRRANLAKHGLDFADAEFIDWRSAIFFDDETVSGEQRARALGWLGSELIYTVYTLRGETCRIISMRHATRSEYRRYADG
jgi:uncharacterized DUF497 family protein